MCCTESVALLASNGLYIHIGVSGCDGRIFLNLIISTISFNIACFFFFQELPVVVSLHFTGLPANLLSRF